MKSGLDIAIMGGTFNPIHNGHIHAAKTVMERLSPDVVMFMVAGTPPHKQVENEAQVRAHRYAMTKLAADELSGIEASDLELKMEGKSYTINTLERMKELYNPKRLSLILGTDMFLSFEKWKSYDKILDMCGLIVLPRFSDSIPDIERKRDGEFARWRDRITVIPADVIEISSSEIRNMVRQGQSIDEYVPPVVSDYIKKHGLYI